MLSRFFNRANALKHQTRNSIKLLSFRHVLDRNPASLEPLLRDSEKINILIQRPYLGQIWLAPIEQNRSRSLTTSRILRLRRNRRWPENGMIDGIFIVSESLKRPVIPELFYRGYGLIPNHTIFPINNFGNDIS